MIFVGKASNLRKHLLKKYIECEPANNSVTASSNQSTSSRNNSLLLLSLNDDSKQANKKDHDSQEYHEELRHKTQCNLNEQGASDLVIDIFTNDVSNFVFKETVLLSIALLEGGNTEVQVHSPYLLKLTIYFDSKYNF